MIELIFAIKFVHLLAAAAMFGTWLAVAVFMQLAHRSRNTAVVALTSRSPAEAHTASLSGVLADASASPDA